MKLVSFAIFFTLLILKKTWETLVKPVFLKHSDNLHLHLQLWKQGWYWFTHQFPC